MARGHVDDVLRVLGGASIPTLDITGGAPELHPDFEYLVSQARALGCRVIDRCNLSVLQANDKEHLVSFLRDHQVEVAASLPYFLAENTDRQRGDGVFAKSLETLQRLNRAGYGHNDSLRLTLAYNPGGAYLPGCQAALETQFRRELLHRYGIAFSQLNTITNMPIGRFGQFLHRSGNAERYWQRLRASFNPATVPHLMCRSLVSVGWDGTLYDCDFNQAVGLATDPDVPSRIEDFDLPRLAGRRVTTADHCFGCTAGHGSSCGGALA
jgi:radical SAM/Cys-rich protein